MKGRRAGTGRFMRLAEKTYIEFGKELKKPSPRKPTRAKLALEVLTILLVYFLIVYLIWIAIDVAFQAPKSFEGIQTFKEGMTVENLTFELYAEFTTESVYVAAGSGIDVRIGIQPRNFNMNVTHNSTTSSLSFYVLIARFPYSHPTVGDYYEDWDEGVCLMDPRESNESSDLIWERVPLYGECGIYYQISGDFPVVVRIERMTVNLTSASSELVGEGIAWHILSISPEESWVQDFYAQSARNITFAAFWLAITSIVIQLLNFLHSTVKKSVSAAEPKQNRTDSGIDQEAADGSLVEDSFENEQKQP